MEIEYIKKPLLDPYRSLGVVVSSKIFLQTTPTLVLASPTDNSYKIYTPKLTIQNISPNFSSKITAIISQNDNTYVRVGEKIIKMSYYHMVKQWIIGQQSNESYMIKIGEAIILGENKKIMVVTSTIQTIHIEFQIKGIVHPLTYINKIIVFGNRSLQLWNVSSHKLIYDFVNFIQKELEFDEIITIQASTNPDILAISCSSGRIIFFDIRSDKIIFQLKQKSAALSMSFSKCTRPILATGVQAGHLIFWDLNEKRILGKIQFAHRQSIDSLIFLPNQLLLISASSRQNSIKQWKYDQIQKNNFRLLRQRNSIKQNINSFTIQSNLDVVINTQSQSLYLSFLSQNNSYLLPKCLDSKLPTHIAAKGQSVQVYYNQTLTKTIPIQQVPLIGKISISQNYFIISTQTRILRVGSGENLQWKIPNALSILLYHQHFIYVLTNQSLYVLDFVNCKENIKSISIENPLFLTQNLAGNFMAIAKAKGIQVWDMKNAKKGRQFIGHDSKILSLSFNSDNKFLFSSAQDKSIKIWDIIGNNLYKTIYVDQNIVYHAMTPDNRFFVTAFKNSRQIKLWHNLIGNICSSTKDEIIKFETSIVKMDENLRKYLNKKNIKQQYQIQSQSFELDKYLDTLSDAEDELSTFTELPKGKWMPLIYYDQIRERNTPAINLQKKIQAPFFLDFNKKDQHMKKLQKQYQEEVKNQSRLLNQKKNKYLYNEQNKLILQRELKDYKKIFQSLKKLTVAELDFEFRNFLLNPLNIVKMVEFFNNLFLQSDEFDLKIVYFNRFLQILSSDLLNQSIKPSLNEIKQKIQQIWNKISHKLYLSQVVCEKNIEAS